MAADPALGAQPLALGDKLYNMAPQRLSRHSPATRAQAIANGAGVPSPGHVWILVQPACLCHLHADVMPVPPPCRCDACALLYDHWVAPQGSFILTARHAFCTCLSFHLLVAGYVGPLTPNRELQRFIVLLGVFHTHFGHVCVMLRGSS